MKKWAVGIALLFCSLYLCYSPFLSWNFNPESEGVSGYKVHSGPYSRNYNLIVDVGNVNSYILDSNVASLLRYYAVTAYATNGLESTYSLEVSCCQGNVPDIQPPYISTSFKSNQVILSFACQADIRYTIEFTTDFILWYPYLSTLRSQDEYMSFPVYYSSTVEKMFFRVKAERE